jgi:hypothetical protein
LQGSIRYIIISYSLFETDSEKAISKLPWDYEIDLKISTYEDQGTGDTESDSDALFFATITHSI